jgi:hypothetical protein
MCRRAMRWAPVLVLMVACTAENPAYVTVRDAEIAADPVTPDAALPRLPADSGASQAAPDTALPLLPADSGASQAAPDTAAPSLDVAPDAAVTGLMGDYFDGNAFNSRVFSRADQIVDFAWANDPPDPRLTFSGFTVRWTGYLRPLYSETYTFTVHSGDGSRLWLDGTPVIDDWRLHAPEDHTGTIKLVANRSYAVRIEYLHETGWSVMRLLWASPSQKAGVVPTTALLPP